MSCHKRDLVLSCHNGDLDLPQQRSRLATTHTSCLATTEILSCHNRDCVFPVLGTRIFFKVPLLGLGVASGVFLRSSFCHCKVLLTQYCLFWSFVVEFCRYFPKWVPGEEGQRKNTCVSNTSLQTCGKTLIMRHTSTKAKHFA